ERELHLAVRSEADGSADGARQRAECGGCRWRVRLSWLDPVHFREHSVWERIRQRRSWIREIVLVEQVEHFHAELRVARAVQREVLRDDEVDLCEPRSVQRAALQVA